MNPEPIDYSASNAILIGVSEYRDPAFPDIPAAANSLRGMHAILTDLRLCGWPQDRVTVIANPEHSARLAQRLRRLAEQTHGVFLLYFVGHGTITPSGELCLTLTDTDATDPDLTGLEYARVRSALSRSPARIRLAVLDCCYSGRAIETLSASSSEIADSVDVRGVYTLTAADHTAHVVSLDQQATAHTSFTAEFVDLIRAGIPAAAQHLTLGALYPTLRSQLAARNLPLPNQRGTDTANLFAFTRNAAYAPPAPQVEASATPSGATEDSSLSVHWPDPTTFAWYDELLAALRTAWRAAGTPTWQEVDQRAKSPLYSATYDACLDGTVMSRGTWRGIPEFLQGLGMSEDDIVQWERAWERLGGRTFKERWSPGYTGPRHEPYWGTLYPALIYALVIAAIPYSLGSALTQRNATPQLGTGNWIAAIVSTLALAASGFALYGSAAGFAGLKWYRLLDRVMVVLCLAAFLAGWIVSPHVGLQFDHHLRDWLAWRF